MGFPRKEALCEVPFNFTFTVVLIVDMFTSIRCSLLWTFVATHGSQCAKVHTETLSVSQCSLGIQFCCCWMIEVIRCSMYLMHETRIFSTSDLVVSVCQFVCLSRGCVVQKRLNGSMSCSGETLENPGRGPTVPPIHLYGEWGYNAAFAKLLQPLGFDTYDLLGTS